MHQARKINTENNGIAAPKTRRELIAKVDAIERGAQCTIAG